MISICASDRARIGRLFRWTARSRDSIPVSELDAIDRKILAALQTDCHVTMQELAAKVGLSAARCHRRVKMLEARGVISGYVALVDQKAIGLPVSVFISIKLERQKEEDLDR